MTIKKLNKQKYVLPNLLNWSPYTRNQKFFQLLPSNRNAIRVCWSIWWWITRQHACLAECWHVGLPSWQIVLSTKYKTDVRTAITCFLRLSLSSEGKKEHTPNEVPKQVLSAQLIFLTERPHMFDFLLITCAKIYGGSNISTFINF